MTSTMLQHVVASACLASAALSLSHMNVNAVVGNVKPSLKGVMPNGSLTHFCIITGWEQYNSTLDTYSTLLGQPAPVPGIAGGPDSNSTYQGRNLMGTTKISFMQLNNDTKMEFLAGQPDQPSWWRDVYLNKGYEVHHMGYMLPTPTPI